MIQAAARTVFNFSKRYFNRLDQILAGWEYRLTHQEFNLKPRSSRGQLPSLPDQIDPRDDQDQLANYDRAAFADSRLKIKDRFWSIGLRRRLINWTRRGLFRIRLLGSRIYFKLIER